MARMTGMLVCVAAVAVAASGFSEIVKVTTPQAPVYIGKKWVALPAKAEGKRFMVYGARPGLYFIQVSAKKKTYGWIRAQDVEVDWGKTKQVRVATVHDTNKLKLSDGEWVQFAGVTVPEGDTPLTRQTLAWLKRLLEGKAVTLEYDPKVRRSGLGYDVAYVYVEGLFVNRVLVERGLASMESTYRNAGGRYADVFGYFSRKARQAGIGIWAGDTPKPEPEPEPAEPEGAAPVTPEPAQPGSRYVRTLSDAEKAQWARSLQTTIQVKTKRVKTNADVESEDDTERVEEISTTKTLHITVKNGWGFALKGLAAKYEVYGKHGKTSASVFFFKEGTLSGMDLAPGQTRQFVSEGFEFTGKDSSDEGWKGSKYYGYRMTFYYKGTPVKVVAVPERLLNYKPPAEEE